MKPNGIVYDLLVERPDLEAAVTAFKAGAPNTLFSFDEMYRIVACELDLIPALNDLIVSISLPHHAPINCARAIETIRELIMPTESDDREKGWKVMREQLNIDRDYLKFITQHSTKRRHGKRTGISPADYQEIIRRAWNVMNRFLEYRKRGNQQLPLSEFPLLTV